MNPGSVLSFEVYMEVPPPTSYDILYCALDSAEANSDITEIAAMAIREFILLFMDVFLRWIDCESELICPLFGPLFLQLAAVLKAVRWTVVSEARR